MLDLDSKHDLHPLPSDKLQEQHKPAPRPTGSTTQRKAKAILPPVQDMSGSGRGSLLRSPSPSDLTYGSTVSMEAGARVQRKEGEGDSEDDASDEGQASVQRKADGGGGDAEDDSSSDAEEGEVQRKASGSSSGKALSPEVAVSRAQQDGGMPVATEIRRKVEQATGADLGGVRVHTGSASQEAAGAIHARAYTIGRDVHFAEGEYQPGTREGDHLIAHELVHTVQQGASRRLQPKLSVSQPGDACEVEADRIADAVVSGRGTTPARMAGAVDSSLTSRQVQRLPGLLKKRPKIPSPWKLVKEIEKRVRKAGRRAKAIWRRCKGLISKIWKKVKKNWYKPWKWPSTAKLAAKLVFCLSIALKDIIEGKPIVGVLLHLLGCLVGLL